jgi:predicted  nucleic acid-binding Zn-ribbon protein
MSDLQTALLGLQEKLQTLLKRQLALEKENHQLKGSLEEQLKVIGQLENELKNEQAALITAQMRPAQQMDPAEKAALNKKIDDFIKEIDHCIQNLNP